MTALHERAHENECTIIAHLASFDCLPKRLIALLLHGKDDNSAITYADKITKRMIRKGLLGRKIAGDGIFRYFLSKRGTYEAAELLRFTPKNGFERSYLNAARYDTLNEIVIRNMHSRSKLSPSAFGKGALRYLFENRLHDVDAALTVIDGEVRRFEYFYLRIDTLADSSLERLERVKKLANEHGARIKIIGPDFVRKKLVKR